MTHAASTLDLLQRLAPVLGFLVALTVLAELADEAELFDVLAVRAARLGGGRTPRLFLLVAVLATVTTVLLSLDTTAVLLTPVVLATTSALALRPLPFALLVVWLANTASLLLPISNLTNLLALDRIGRSAGSYAGTMALPAATAVVVTVAFLGLLFRRDLRGSYVLPPAVTPRDPLLCAGAGVACLAIVPGALLGLAPWTVAAPAAGALVLAFAVRRPRALGPGLVPWRICLGVTGLVLLVGLAARHGLDDLVARALGGDDLAGSARTAAVAAGAANVVNNLPAYLGLESAVPAGDPRVLHLLLGVDLGPLVLLWGSLATLLWRQRCRAAGLEVSARTFALVGLAGVPLVLGSALVALAVGPG